MPRRSVAMSVIRRIFAAWAMSMLLSFFVICLDHTVCNAGCDRRRAQCGAPGFRPGIALVVERRAAQKSARSYDRPHRYEGSRTRHAMRIAVTCAVLLLVPALGLAKSKTARIEILHGKRPFLTLSGADTAGQFTIWSGLGTVVTAADGTESTPEHPGDIADWRAGAVPLPRDSKVYKVRFYCAAGDAPAREGGTTR